MDEGATKDFKVTASDIDLEQLYYSWFLDGKEVSDAKTDAYSYSPDFKSAGTHKVKVAVTDSKVEVTKEWKVTVKNINRAPTVNLTSPIATQKYKEGKVSFSAVVADPDGDATTITWYIDNKPVPSSNAATVLATVKGGTHIIKITASDGTASTSQEVTISVSKKPGTTPGFEAFILIGAVLAVALVLRRKK